LILNGTLEWPLSIVRYLVRVLFSLNDLPHGTERGYNALRLALALQKRDQATALSLFLMADSVVAVRSGQQGTGAVRFCLGR
jgi:sulfur relay (sulfurtransferase) complex TusBCD TusD component (DsrE family)